MAEEPGHARSGLTPCSPGTRIHEVRELSIQQRSGFDLKGGGQPVHDVDGRVVDAALQRTDVGSIEIGAMRELFLRKASGAAGGAEIAREDLSDIHAESSAGCSGYNHGVYSTNIAPLGNFRRESDGDMSSDEPGRTFIVPYRYFGFLPGLAVLAMTATAAEARPAKCLLEVGEIAYIDGPCDFDPDRRGDGSFKIMASDGMYFAYLNVEGAGVAVGYWNEEPGANHAHTPLGKLTRDGACWVGEGAKLCAW